MNDIFLGRAMNFPGTFFYWPTGIIERLIESMIEVGWGKRVGNKLFVNKWPSPASQWFTDFTLFSLFLFWFGDFRHFLLCVSASDNTRIFSLICKLGLLLIIVTVVGTKIVRITFIYWKSSPSVRFTSGENSPCPRSVSLSDAIHARGWHDAICASRKCLFFRFRIFDVEFKK